MVRSFHRKVRFRHTYFVQSHHRCALLWVREDLNTRTFDTERNFLYSEVCSSQQDGCWAPEAKSTVQMEYEY